MTPELRIMFLSIASTWMIIVFAAFKIKGMRLTKTDAVIALVPILIFGGAIRFWLWIVNLFN